MGRDVERRVGATKPVDRYALCVVVAAPDPNVAWELVVDELATLDECQYVGDACRTPEAVEYETKALVLGTDAGPVVVRPGRAEER